MTKTARVLEKLKRGTALALVTTLAAGPALAGQSDVDLFTGAGNLPPNIMLLLDSSGSMRDLPSSGGYTSKIDIAKSALTNLITTVNPSDGSGGYTENARFGLFTFRLYGGQLDAPITSGNTGAVLAAIAAETAPGGVGTPIAAATLDVGRYFAGSRGWGTIEKWGNLAGESSTTDPFDYSCRDTFLIAISDGLPTLDSVKRNGFWATIGDSDGDDGVGEGNPENNYWNREDSGIQWGDDITYSMYRHDFSPLEGLQNVTTHVIGFDVSTPILSRMATNGGGQYRTTTTSAGLASALADATAASFDDIASYSTAVVPTARTRFGSAFYNAFFEPDDNDTFWEGHLEAYGLDADGEIVDQNGDPAVDPNTDELYDPHLPYWDAGIVLRSQSTRNLYTTVSGNRVAFDNTNVTDTMMGLTAGELGFYPNYPASGATTTADLRDALIDYLTGLDGFDEDNDTVINERRSKVLGDIFHSTPRIVGAPTSQLVTEQGYSAFYNTYKTRDRVIYAGANDGMLHAFDAGEYVVGDDPSTTTVVETAYYTPGYGTELFGYVPGLLLDDVKYVPLNNPRTYYFVDGSPVAADVWIPQNASDFTKDTAEWTTVLMTGFREGGAGYITLDVTDPDATSGAHYPYANLLWEFTDSKLGQAWSEPVITRVKVEEGSSGDKCGPDDGDGNCKEHWVAIFAGGYESTADPNHPDFAATPADPDWTPRSKAIFMVDIATGQVLHSVSYDSTNHPEMVYAMPSTPAVLDLDFDGFADMVYVGDLGGQLWKWDIHAVGQDTDLTPGIDTWPAGRVFRSAPATLTSGSLHYRSFFFPPTATFARGRLVLTFASGEREQLRYAGDASADENNRLYVMRDPVPTGTGAIPATPYSESNLTDVTYKLEDDDYTDLGYFFSVRDGEKFTSEVLIFAGYGIAVSYSPEATSADPCLAIGGLSRLYVFELSTGSGYWRSTTSVPPESRAQTIGGGLASTPRISISPDPEDDQLYVKTSKGRVIKIDPPTRRNPGAGMIYWKQDF